MSCVTSNSDVIKTKRFEACLERAVTVTDRLTDEIQQMDRTAHHFTHLPFLQIAGQAGSALGLGPASCAVAGTCSSCCDGPAMLSDATGSEPW